MILMERKFAEMDNDQNHELVRQEYRTLLIGEEH